MSEATQTVEKKTGASRTEGRGLAKVREGVVLSDKMSKTLVVGVTRQTKHPTYGKYIQRTKKYYVHDEKEECGIGDTVEIVETRPLSRLKRWRVRRVVTKAAE